MTSTRITKVPLSEVETTRLMELENIVSTAMRTFVEIGDALAEIRDSKLSRATHGTSHAADQSVGAAPSASCPPNWVTL
jgi:hypothetical protein